MRVALVVFREVVPEAKVQSFGTTANIDMGVFPGKEVLPYPVGAAESAARVVIGACLVLLHLGAVASLDADLLFLRIERIKNKKATVKVDPLHAQARLETRCDQEATLTSGIVLLLNIQVLVVNQKNENVKYIEVLVFLFL